MRGAVCDIWGTDTEAPHMIWYITWGEQWPKNRPKGARYELARTLYHTVCEETTMGLTINEVLGRLEHVKSTGTNKWKASCPCAGHKHGDRSQSMTVHLNDNGKIDVYCHRDHSLEEICGALGIKSTDLLPAKTYTDPKQSLITYYAKQNGLKFVREYSYCYGTYTDGLCKLKFIDADGEKTFRWIKKDSGNKSGYAFNHTGCANRLYIAGDPDAEVVYLCEGEKDAEALHDLTGCTAASAEHGATATDDGKKWLDAYTRQLNGKTVYILYDNDDVGRAWAQIEAQKLSSASNVLLLNLPEAWPECPEKGDISDAIDELGEEETKQLLAQMMNSASKKEEPKPAEDPFMKFIKDIQGTKYKPVETGMKELDEMLGGGILRQSLVILLAAPSAGKTTFSQQLLETMAENGNDVVFMNLEMSREQLYARSISRIMQKQGNRLSASGVLKGYSWTKEQRQNVLNASMYYARNIRKHMVYNPDGMTTDIDSIREVLESAGRKAREEDPDAPGPIVCLDYLHLVSSAQRIDGSEIIKSTVATLKEYAMKYNTFVVLVSASNRASNASGKQTMESGRDTSAVEYSADYLLGLNYKAFEEYEPGSSDKKVKLEELQQQTPRKMVLKVMKNRLDGSGRKIYLDFDAASSTFTYAGKPDKYTQQGYTKVEIDADEVFDYSEAEDI